MNGRAAASRGSQPFPVAAERHALRTMIIDMVAPVAVYCAARALGGSVWVSRPLLEGRRIFDLPGRARIRPASTSWDEMWERVPRFRRIWRVCTVIWGSAILADAVVRVVMAYTLPIGLVPALGGTLWPVTFIAPAVRDQRLLRQVRLLAHPPHWCCGAWVTLTAFL